MIKLKETIYLSNDLWSDGIHVYDSENKILRVKKNCDCYNCFNDRPCYFPQLSASFKYFVHENMIEIYSFAQEEISELHYIKTQPFSINLNGKGIKAVLEFNGKIYKIKTQYGPCGNIYFDHEIKMSRWNYYKRHFYDYSPLEIFSGRISIKFQPAEFISLLFLIFKFREPHFPKLIAVKIIEFFLIADFEEKMAPVILT